MAFIDSHCHLDKLVYSRSGKNEGDTCSGQRKTGKKREANRPCNLGEALERARLRDVAGFLCVNIDLQHFRDVLAVAESHSDVWCSAGVHPLAELRAADLYEEQLLELATLSEKVVAIGECGLDYYYQKEHHANQRAIFESQLNVASVIKKPVIVHTRDARQDTMALLEKYSGRGVNGVLHCFTETLEMAEMAVDLGFYISFSGIITFRNADSLRNVVKSIPLERMLIETDSPYLAPAPHRGKSNLPEWVVEVAQTVAEIKSCSLQEVAHATTENFFRLFNLNKRDLCKPGR